MSGRSGTRDLNHLCSMDQLADFADRFETRIETFVLIELDGFFPLVFALNQGDSATLIDQIAGILYRAIGSAGVVCRVGDSRFAMLWSRPLNEGQITIFASRMLRHLADIPLCRRAALSIGPRMGIHCRMSSESCFDAIRHAHQALTYTDLLEHRFRLYEPRMEAEIVAEARLRQRLASAMEKQHFNLVYQPRVEVSTGRTISVEALIRWEDDTQIIMPETFLGLLEQSGDILELTRWVFNRAAHELRPWLNTDPRRSFSFNLSASALATPELVDTFIHTVKLWNLRPGQVVIEVTESTAWEVRDRGKAQIEKLRAQGIRFALDDFGTGYSTFDYLRHMPLDILKVDKSFVDNMVADATDRFIVETIISVARGFGLEVIAEGVETERQLELLTALGVDGVQGYCFAQPMPVSEFLRWFRDV